MEVKALKTAMTDSISEVLETMFFLTVDMDMDDEGALDSLGDSHDRDTMIAQLDFTGPFSGIIYFLIPGSLAASITSSFLGIDGNDVTQSQISETVNEIINMVAGNTFSMYDDQEIFNLGVPEAIPFEGLSIDRLKTSNALIVPVRTPENRLFFVISCDA